MKMLRTVIFLSAVGFHAVSSAKQCSLEGKRCDVISSVCCPSLTCTNPDVGECVLNPNVCRAENTRCTNAPGAPFYEICCYGLMCVDSNGNPGNGTCKEDPTATQRPCRPLHELCAAGGVSCCGDRKCEREDSPDPFFGVCRELNETQPYCLIEHQDCTPDIGPKCCTGLHCDDSEFTCEKGDQATTELYHESTTEASEQKTSTEPATTTHAVTSTTQTPPFCVKEKGACLLGVLLKTCCPGLKCNALVLGKCVPV